MVDIAEERHELEFCSAFKSEPAFGGCSAYTPIKRARLIEFTRLENARDESMKYPP